ncbi:MAG TPA: lamin tail domain-containing protein, partial [Vicinamibacterales bacterium]
MTKKSAAIAAVLLTLLVQRPHAQSSQARIYFIDVGTGASTLIVSPTGKTLLVDGGPPGSGAKITGLLDTLGITTIDFTVLTHYHIDHMGGLIEVLNAGRVAGTSFDNGDGAGVQPPGTSTSSSSTRGTYLNYVTATGHSGVTRRTVVAGAIPDGFLDLGGGMRATFMVAGGRFLSGGSVAITNEDLNSESISTLVEYNSFDYLVSGDMTGGGSTSTAKTPDVETYVAQMVGDVDVVQLDHHGSTTANNQVFLSALKAEVAFAQTGETNTFGHPNRETANKYLNTPDTAGHSFLGTGVAVPPGVGPVFYQNEASPAGDERVTQQGYTGAAAGNAGHGTVLLTTDGSTTYTMSSFDDGGARISPALHTYAVDGVSPGITTDFKPTVIAQIAPVLPRANESVVVSAAVNDRESPIASASLAYSVDGVAKPPIPMTLAGGLYQATIPAQANGSRVDYTVTGATGTQSSSFSLGYFSGVTPIASLHAETAKGEPLYNGYAARIQGTVTASGFTPGTNDDYVQDATAAINVYRSTDTPTGFTSTAPGQVVEVSGRINFNGGRLRLDLTESVEKTSSPYGILVLSSAAAPTPAATTIAALNANPESLEGKFVSLSNVKIVSGTIPTTPQSNDTFVTVSDATGSFSMKIDHHTDVAGFTPASPFTLVGILQQDDYLRPFDSGYNVTPRSRVDLGAAAPAPTPLVTIAEARIDQINNVDSTPGVDFVPDRLNQIVRIHGVVSTIDFRGGNGIEYYVQDGTGGVDLFNTATNFGPFAIGDRVEAVGTITQFFGLTEITVSSMSLLSHDAAPAARVITLAQLAAGGGEAFEGQLVKVAGVRITSGSFPALNSSATVTIADATGTAQLYIDSDTDIDGTATPNGSLTVTGVVGQHASTTLDNGYQIIPSALTDIVAGGTASIVISEFRLHGSAGGNDEFVEIYNNGDGPADISGYTLRGSNNAGANGVRATVPANVILPGRSHYLFTNAAANGYSLSVPGNVTYPTGITDDGGLALFTPGAGGTVVDAVGLSAGSAFKEGSTLAPLTTNANRGYERLPGGTA